METMELGARLMLLGSLRRNMLQADLPDGTLKHGQLPVLAAIIGRPDSTQAALAERLRVTPASIALSTKRLERAGLIERRTDPDNRRCNRLRATAAGHEAAAVSRRSVAAVDARSFSGFTEAEKIQLAAFFDRMISNMTDGEKVALFPFFKEDIGS